VHIAVLLEAGFKKHNAIVAQQLNLAFAGETAVQLQLIACARHSLAVSAATPASMNSQQLPAVGFSGLFCVVAASRYLLFRVPCSAFLPADCFANAVAHGRHVTFCTAWCCFCYQLPVYSKIELLHSAET
jgi:hypothetical protein